MRRTASRCPVATLRRSAASFLYAGSIRRSTSSMWDRVYPPHGVGLLGVGPHLRWSVNRALGAPIIKPPLTVSPRRLLAASRNQQVLFTPPPAPTPTFDIEKPSARRQPLVLPSSSSSSPSSSCLVLPRAHRCGPVTSLDRASRRSARRASFAYPSLKGSQSPRRQFAAGAGGRRGRRRTGARAQRKLSTCSSGRRLWAAGTSAGRPIGTSATSRAGGVTARSFSRRSPAIIGAHVQQAA